MKKVNLAKAFTQIDQPWQPHIAGSVNDAHVKLAKFSGAFEWHHHTDEDELFLVIKGRMRMGLRTGNIDVGEGEYLIVPRGTEHRPEALTGDCHVLLLEPKTTLNTGNIRSNRTVENPNTLD